MVPLVQTPHRQAQQLGHRSHMSINHSLLSLFFIFSLYFSLFLYPSFFLSPAVYLSRSLALVLSISEIFSRALSLGRHFSLFLSAFLSLLQCSSLFLSTLRISKARKNEGVKKEGRNALFPSFPFSPSPIMANRKGCSRVRGQSPTVCFCDVSKK